MDRKTFKQWPVRCSCGFTGKVLAWSHELPPSCPTCSQPTELVELTSGKSAAITTDDIPGGMLVRHGTGMTHPDGSPKLYYSRTELKRAANENGWTISGDTPKPYRVNCSGKPNRNY